MVKILKNEWLKVRKSGLLWLSFGITLFSPFVILLMVAILNSDSSHNAITFYEFLAMVLRLITTSVSILFYTYFASELIAREFRNDTFKSQLTIPILRTDFIFGKILLVTVWVLTINILSFLFSILLSAILKLDGFELVILNKLFGAYLKAGILVLPFAYFSIVLVLYFKNIFIPMVINVIMFIISISITKSDIYAIFPWTAPSRIIFIANSGTEIKIPMFNSYASLFWLTVICIYFSYKRINKMEF